MRMISAAAGAAAMGFALAGWIGGTAAQAQAQVQDKTAATTPPAMPPLEAFGALPTVSTVDISPDGTLLAILVGPPDNRQLQIRKAEDRKLVSVSGLSDVKVRGIVWAGNDTVLIVRSTTAKAWNIEGPRREYMQLSELNFANRRVATLMNDVENGMNIIDSMPVVVMEDGKAHAYVEGLYFPDQRGTLALYRVSMATTMSKRTFEGHPDTVEIAIGPDGQAVARADYAPKPGLWTLHLRLKGKPGWTQVYSETAPVDTPDLDGLGRDGASVLIRTRDKDGGWVVRAASLIDGSLSAPLDDFAGRGVIPDPASRVAIGAEGADMAHTTYHFFAPRDQKVWDAIASAFKGEEVTLASWSDDRKSIVVKVEGQNSGAGFYWVDLAKGKAAFLADEYAGVPTAAIAEQRVIEYKAADGLAIPAYLTLPKGRGEKNLPLVVLPHGGPAARDDPGFDWWAQATASRGYAVLQPQFRGSNGFGEEFLEAGYGEWGRKMQTDLSDGVRDLVKRGIVDPARVCIMGASYGGYAALAAATFDPKPYRCAVDLAGPADLRRMLTQSRMDSNGEDLTTQRYWSRFMGAKDGFDPRLDEISPALHADKAAIPILIIHGQDDTVVSPDQSKEMAASLQKAGKTFEYVTLKGEDHWLSRGETRIQMLKAAMAFVEKNNPPQ